MKTEPTDIDRKAASLFTPAPGMRVWRAITADTLSEPGMVLEVDSQSAGIRTDSGWSWFSIAAIDADDPATVGCMLAQVEAVAGKPIDTWMSTKGPMPDLPYAVESGPYVTIGRGATRGHALLAAMRRLKRAS